MHLQITGTGDVSIWMKRSRMGQKKTNKQTNKKKVKEFKHFFLQIFVSFCPSQAILISVETLECRWNVLNFALCSACTSTLQWECVHISLPEQVWNQIFSHLRCFFYIFLFVADRLAVNIRFLFKILKSVANINHLKHLNSPLDGTFK